MPGYKMTEATRIALLALIFQASRGYAQPLDDSACKPALEPEYHHSHLGCYADPGSSTFGSNVLDAINSVKLIATTQNSPEFCATLCGQAGYSKAGVEAGS